MEHCYTTNTPSKAVKKKFTSNKICSVPQCSQRAYKYTHTSLHSFPADKAARVRWAKVLKMGKIPKNAYACSRHFTENDFIVSKKGNGKVKRLKSNVIPSMNIPKTSILARSKSAEKKVAQSTENRNARLARRKLLFEQRHTVPEANETAVMEVELEHNVPDVDVNRVSDVELHLNVIPDPEIKRQIDQCVQVDLTFYTSKPITVLDMLHSDEQILAFTGLKSIASFRRLGETMQLLEPKIYTGKNFELDICNRVLLTLMKLKMNCSYRCLAAFFNISSKTASTYFVRTVHVMHKFAKNLVPWPSREEVRRNLPVHFEKYLKTRIIIDCTEFPVACCRCLNCRVRCYSHYKGTHTLKVLIGVSPGGLLTFLSDVYGGRASDKFIFLNSSLLERLEVGDHVMADKGFFIGEECKQKGIQLIQPPFLRNSRFNTQEAQDNYDVAQARVHVERFIQRIKTFKILKDKVCWDIVPYFDEILLLICSIVNLSHPILADNKFKHM